MEELLQISTEIDALARQLGDVPMTAEQRFEQEVSFIVGNLMDAFEDPAVITERTVKTVLSGQG